MAIAADIWLGTNDRGTYAAVQKADGGYDVIHTLPNGTIELSSFQDAGVALNKDFSNFITDRPVAGDDYISGPGGAGGSGPTQAQVDAYNARVNENYQLAVNKMNRDKDEQLRGFMDQTNDLEKQGVNLGKSRDQGYSGNSAYFNAVSPDAFQSQIGNYNQKVLDAYNEGMGTVNQNKERVSRAKTNYEADVADYLRGLDLQRQGDLQSYGTGGNYANYSYKGAAPEALAQVNTEQPAMYSAGNSIPTIADAMARYGTTNINRQPDDPWAFLG